MSSSRKILRPRDMPVGLQIQVDSSARSPSSAKWSANLVYSVGTRNDVGRKL